VLQGDIGLYEWNPVTQQLWWDESLTAIFGARPGEETPLDTWYRRVHPEDRDRVLATFSCFDRAEDLYRIVMDDGSTRHILSRATYVMHDPDGTPLKVVGVMLDVTATYAAQTRLSETLESIGDGFLALDHEYRVTYVNAKAEQVVGLPRSELLGRVLWDVFPAGIGTQFQEVYERVMRTQVSESFEEYYPEPLNMWIEVRAQPSSEGLLLYFQDVSARRVEQDERERLLVAERQAREDAEHAKADAEQARAAAERTRAQLAHEATHDGLTGLLNRSQFENLTVQCLRDTRVPVTALFLDLDRFKLVNDSLGHAAGDALLVQVAQQICPLVREDDVVARLGGDEFVVLLVGHDTEAAQVVAERLLVAVRHPVNVLGSKISTTASIGLATAGPDATVQTLLRDADVALYRAKDGGRNQFAWFDAAAHRALLDRVALEADLRAALEAGDLEVHYQPAYSLETDRVVGVEGLARWQHAQRGAVPPALFIPLAEDTGLIEQLGAMVIRSACAQAARWSELPDFVVWVNVSGRQLETPGLATLVLKELAGAGVPPYRFGVEVTESVLMDEQLATQELAELATAGVSVAIDDFGTGYSSLARLTTLPVQVLKVDRSFVADLDIDRGRAAIDVVVHLARAYGLTTLAEGIETPEQLELLRAAGIDAGCGYLLGRPAPAADLRLDQPRREGQCLPAPAALIHAR
jgi:diguanylate cyclase (GGDEF)-like protein/PAS domain S-box-containing protein